jgi:hypothetical protein
MVYRRSDLASGRAIVIGEMPGLEAHSVERKLAAIFAADVEGYSRLMGLDEVGTLRTLTAYRVVIDRLASGVGSIAVPPATPAPRNGPIERPAASNRPREGSLASRQAPAGCRAAPARHPRPASTEFRRGKPPAAGSLPAFLRRPSPTKPSSVGRRGEQRGRSAASRFDGAR